MDPLTALGLASNIVQFVDFTSKLISTAHSLYTSTSGAKAEHLELEALANTLRGLADNAAPPSQGTKNVSFEESTFIELGRAPIGTVRFELYIIRFDLFGSYLNKSSIRSNLLKFDSNRNCNRTLVT
jgi:hypothetical protein